MKTPVSLELCTSLFIFGLPPIMPLMYHQHTFGLKSFNTFGQMLGDRRRRRTGVQVERSAEQGMAAIHPLVLSPRDALGGFAALPVRLHVKNRYYTSLPCYRFYHGAC